MLTTVSNRVIPLPPRIRLDTNRKTTIDLKKLKQWLIDQAKLEAEFRKDDFNLAWISQEKSDNLPQASMDSMNVYLFGEVNPVIIPE